MRKLKAVKASLLLATLLFGMCVAFTPAPAKAIGIFNGIIDIDYDTQAIPDTIKPEADIVRIPVYIYYYVAGLGSGFVVPFFRSNTAQVSLEVGDHPDYLTATLSKGLVQPFLGTKKPDTPESTVLTVTFNQNAPAFQSEEIEIVAKTKDQNLIKGTEQKLRFTVKSGFYQDFTYDYIPQKEATPGELVNFPITITGYANARSKLQFEIIDKTEKWSPSINSQLTLGTKALGENATGTVNFVVQSPLDFGYHNEIGQFTIRVTTYAVGHESEGVQNTTHLYFTIRNRGFSTPGFEVAFTILALIAIIVVYKKRK
jgi:hypothetical protein